jgi:hypothetical protein
MQDERKWELSLYLIKHQAILTYGGIEIQLHAF